VDLHEVAETIATAGGGGGVRFRQGTVVSVQSDGTITATIAGSTISVTGIKCWASVVPQPGHGVWLATDGVDLIAVGTVGGPSTFAGEVKMFAGAAASAPPGWLACDGSPVSRATYAALFSAIGTTYGAGDGSTTFNLPDFRDRFAVGGGTSYAPGATGGEATHVLAVGEMPSHAHNLTQLQFTNSDGTGPYTPTPVRAGLNSSRWTDSVGSPSISSTGGGGAHENRPPYLAVTFVIKT